MRDKLEDTMPNLERRTELGMTGCLLAIIRSRKAESETIAIAAEVLAAEARFNGRVAVLKYNHRLNEDDFLALLNWIEALVERCRAAYEVFNADCGLSELHAHNEKLQEELAKIKREYEEAQRLDKA